MRAKRVRKEVKSVKGKRDRVSILDRGSGNTSLKKRLLNKHLLG